MNVPLDGSILKIAYRLINYDRLMALVAILFSNYFKNDAENYI